MSGDLQPHVSHDWCRFEEAYEADRLMCQRCQICTCHSPELSADPCEFATTEAGV